MRDHARIDPELRKRAAAVLAVYDDPVETLEQRLPERAVRGGPPRQDVVRGEHRRDARTQQHAVELGRGQPLKVEHVRSSPDEVDRPGHVFDDFQRNAERRPAKDPRRDRIKRFDSSVSQWPRRFSEAEVRRDQVDVRAGAGKRRGELVVVGRCERGWIGEDDAHRRLQ